jgi:hypothetical protein
LPGARELLDAAVLLIDDVDEIVRIDRDEYWGVELAVSWARRSPRGEENPGAGELLNPVVVLVGNIDVVVADDGDPLGFVELPIVVAAGSPLGDKL